MGSCAHLVYRNRSFVEGPQKILRQSRDGIQSRDFLGTSATIICELHLAEIFATRQIKVF